MLPSELHSQGASDIVADRERDYPVRRELLPEGWVMLSRMQITFPSAKPRL